MSEADELLNKLKTAHSSEDVQLVQSAIEFAAQVHKDQKRLSGDPYITHPLAVANILFDLEQDPMTIAAGLLHDSVEDGNVTLEDITKKFGAEIATLVYGVTKLGKLSFESKEERQAENFRKMFLSMGEDIRVIIIKLSDRLHNMKTIEFLPTERQRDVALETREIFAPLAHRLGMWSLKWQLEDLAFRVLNPDDYRRIKNQVLQKREGREQYINEFIERLNEQLSKVNITAHIYGRAKHFFSIYRKLMIKNIEFDDLYDLFAVRVIVDSVKDCYAVLGVVHSVWKPIPGRFRDHIAVPKSNGYQSLHTTVIGHGGKPVEVQIRTKDMHRIAEYGIAAHWRYKEGGGVKSFDSKLAWLRQMLEVQSDMADAKDFLENLKTDLFVDEIFIFTPKGDVISLPAGSTTIDFAYRVHTEVGHKCIGAKINGRIVNLDHKLESGDIIEILLAKTGNPKLDWISMARTPGARSKIKHWFKKQKREENIISGKESLMSQLKAEDLNSDIFFEGNHLQWILSQFNLENIEDLYVLIGQGEISPFQVYKKLSSKLSSEKILVPREEEIKETVSIIYHRKKSKKSGIKVSGLSNVLVKISKCCAPLPGDEIVGFVTKGKGVSIHRRNCKNVLLESHDKAKMVDVDWVLDPDVTYPVEIEVEAFDKVGQLRDIVAKISETKTNISGAKVKTKRGSFAVINFIVDVTDKDHLQSVMSAIKNVADVVNVDRYIK